MALRCTKEAEAWAKEDQDAMATTEDEASKSMAEAKKRVKVLRRELKDAHW